MHMSLRTTSSISELFAVFTYTQHTHLPISTALLWSKAGQDPSQTVTIMNVSAFKRQSSCPKWGLPIQNTPVYNRLSQRRSRTSVDQRETLISSWDMRE